MEKSVITSELVSRLVAMQLHAYFARHRVEAIERGQDHLAPLPDAETIEAIIAAAFWASLRREEGYSPRISLAVLSPEEALQPLILERPIPLGPAALTRLRPRSKALACISASGATTAI